MGAYPKRQQRWMMDMTTMRTAMKAIYLAAGDLFGGDLTININWRGGEEEAFPRTTMDDGRDNEESDVGNLFSGGTIQYSNKQQWTTTNNNNNSYYYYYYYYNNNNNNNTNPLTVITTSTTSTTTTTTTTTTITTITNITGIFIGRHV